MQAWLTAGLAGERVASVKGFRILQVTRMEERRRPATLR